MEDIGCHFKLEKLYGTIYHDSKILLSSGRNCLRYIIRQRKIKNIYLPYFLCESLSDICTLEKINIFYYHVNERLLPIDVGKIVADSYLYFVNYFGLLRKAIPEIIDKYKNVIIDNTHDFFDNNTYISDTIYNYRKYFGVPDGACIVSKDLIKDETISRGKSLNKILEIVSRDERGEYFHYPSFKEADKYYSEEDLCYMSNFTENYIKVLPYDTILKKRKQNIKILDDQLGKFNKIDIENYNYINYMYPFFVNNGKMLRNYLIENGIYSAMLWPPVEWNGSSNQEKYIANNMVLLPIDQRYGENEMDYITKKIKAYYKS